MNKEEFDLELENMAERCRKAPAPTRFWEPVVRNFDFYEKIKSMDYKVLPFIREAYDMNCDWAYDMIKDYGLPYIIKKILGDKFPISVPDIWKHDVVKKWLDYNLSKYVS
jgi:hypothetical protein